MQPKNANGSSVDSSVSIMAASDSTTARPT